MKIKNGYRLNKNGKQIETVENKAVILFICRKNKRLC